MYQPGNKKTGMINQFIRTAVIRPRDIYARYGERRSTRAILSTDGSSSSTVIPQGSSVIENMIRAQDSLSSSLTKDVKE